MEPFSSNGPLGVESFTDKPSNHAKPLKLVLRWPQSTSSCTDLYLCFRPNKLFVALANARCPSICAFDLLTPSALYEGLKKLSSTFFIEFSYQLPRINRFYLS